MATITVPVSPYTYADGSIASLASLASPEKVVISGNGPKQLPESPTTTFASASVSVDVASNLGFGSLASVNTSGSATYLVIDFFVDCAPVPGKAGTIIVNEHYGAGFRICVKAWSLKSNVSGEFASIAAQCTTQGAQSSYEIAFHGLGLADLGPVVPFIGGSAGSFDASAVERMGALIAATEEAIFSGGPNVRPVLYAVDIDPASASLPYKSTFSVCYAAQSILNNYSVEEALQKKPHDVPMGGTIEDDMVKAVYQKVQEWAAQSADPAYQRKLIAKGILFSGE